VCGGFAHQYGYRPWVVRLVVAAIIVLIPGFNVIPILAYVLLGFLLPESDLY
jgi:phage shock protein PspC (stress-responsive transcriptional regulator)